MTEDLATVARRICLQNAAEHGSADAKRLMGRVMGAHPEFRADPGAVAQALHHAAAEVNALGQGGARAALEAEAPELLQVQKRERQEGLRPLPGADDVAKVVLRFAPNPNGPLSLGHARGVAVMAEYARMHDGEVVLRLDDTDPQVKPPLWDEARGWNGYDMCVADYTWLAGREPDRIVKASDRLTEYYDHARQVIRQGGAYVCTCEAGAWRDLKNQATPCQHRDSGVEANLAAFDRMVEGDFAAGQAVLRIKTRIDHPDPALRDWTAFRIVAEDAVHPREAAGEIGHYACWPLLDFESAIEDHLQGVTHIIRGKDLMDSTRKQHFLYEHLGWTYPQTLYWGRIKIHEFGKFSTSWMRQHIENGNFEGWDDPRLPTIAALRRRGYDASALRRFWVSLGLSEKDVAVSMENLDAEDAKAHDDVAPRRFFVPDPVKLHVDGIEGRVAKPLVHPSFPDRGARSLTATASVVVPAADLATSNGRLRLKDLGNLAQLSEGGATAGDRGTPAPWAWQGADLDRSVAIVQWLPDDATAFRVLRPVAVTSDAPPDSLPSLHEINGQVEGDLSEWVGKVVQFERFGFVRVETPSRGIWLHS